MRGDPPREKYLLFIGKEPMGWLHEEKIRSRPLQTIELEIGKRGKGQLQWIICPVIEIVNECVCHTTFFEAARLTIEAVMMRVLLTMKTGGRTGRKQRITAPTSTDGVDGFEFMNAEITELLCR